MIHVDVEPVALDKSKVPSYLLARALWAHRQGSEPAERPIAFVTERKRWLLGGLVVVLVFAAVVVMAVVHASALLAIPALATGFVGSHYALGGRAGFYEVAEDGSLGEYLGRVAPWELRAMRRARIR